MRKMIFAFTLLVSAALNGQALPTPLQIFTVDPGFMPPSKGLGVPKWERGFLVGVDRDLATVYAASRSGALAMRVRLWPAGSKAVFVRDVSVSPNGAFAAALILTNADGAGVSAIAWLDGAGNITRLVQIQNAEIHRISFADDGTLWALVRGCDAQSYELPSYDLLRHYDSKGLLIGTALSRSSFGQKGFPAERASDLVASHDRIGLYGLGLSKGAPHVWVEVSYTGELLGQWSIKAPDRTFWRFALTGSNNLYIQFQSAAGVKPSARGVVRFDRGASSVTDLDGSAVPNGRLVGADGENLVFSDSPSGNKVMLANVP